MPYAIDDIRPSNYIFHCISKDCIHFIFLHTSRLTATLSRNISFSLLFFIRQKYGSATESSNRTKNRLGQPQNNNNNNSTIINWIFGALNVFFFLTLNPFCFSNNCSATTAYFWYWYVFVGVVAVAFISSVYSRFVWSCCAQKAIH